MDILDITNKSTMNIHVHLSVRTYAFSDLDKYCKRKMTRSVASVGLTF